MKKIAQVLVTLLILLALECFAYNWLNKLNPFASTKIEKSGITQTKIIEISNITAIDLSSIGTLSIHVCPLCSKEMLEIIADEKIMPHIKVQNVSVGISNRLTLSTDDAITKGNTIKEDEIAYHLIVKSLESINASGAVIIKTETPIVGKHLSVSVSGSVKVEADMEVDKLSIYSSGASKITLKGVAQRQDCNLSGAIAYDGAYLKSSDVACNISGASSVKLYALRHLSGVVSGRTKVTYYGNPITSITASGYSSINYAAPYP